MTSLSLEQIDSNPAVDKIQTVIERLPQCVLPLVHRFAGDCYAREMIAPKGAFIVGKVHKTEHFFILLRGRMVVWDESGGVREVVAPFIGVTPPGTRRLGFAKEECSWVTFHPTKERDIKKLEDELTEDRAFDRQTILNDSQVKHLCHLLQQPQ